MSTAVSTPPPSFPGIQNQSNDRAIPAGPKATSSSNQSYNSDTNRVMNRQSFQENRKGIKSQTLENTSALNISMDGLKHIPHQGSQKPNIGQEDGSVSEPARKTGQSSLSKNKKKGRQSGKDANNRTVSQPGGPGILASVRPMSTGYGSNTTPGRPLGTPPKQAYAGPTFHASPAPSALPIPRFFSRSVPEPVSNNGLQAQMDESSSEASESSPIPAMTQTAGQQQAREESPLDIFFKADREEKAKAKSSTPSATPLQSKTFTMRSSPSPPSNSPSPSNGLSRQHSRHPTGGSATDMFALEMDGGDVSIKPTVTANPRMQSDRINASRSNTAPSSMITQNSQAEEQRRAKTQALKNLLLSPQPQSPSSSPRRYAPSAYELDGNLESSSPTPTSRKASSPPTMTPVADPTKDYARRSPHGNFPFLHESLLTTANGSPRPVPRSSNLRQELSATTTPHRGVLPTELPASPSPQTTISSAKPDAPSTSRNNPNSHIYGHLNGASYALPPSAQSPGLLNVSCTSTTADARRSATDMRVMEDGLRRILKMEVLKGAGVSGLGNGDSRSATSGENRPPLNGTRDGISGL
ncbi:MAG: hypothetical protein M1812_003807 [Candelaria pacifica]|nr:MAG: hypothetical protein M1812_003807 [Candelaria pacifica]